MIIDDKSDENSCDIVKKKTQSPQNNVNSTELKWRTTHARNVGINAANWELIQFLDSDDIFCSDLFKKFELSKSPGSIVIYFSYQSY